MAKQYLCVKNASSGTRCYLAYPPARHAVKRFRTATQAERYAAERDARYKRLKAAASAFVA